MTTDRWDPLQDLLSLHEKMNRLFEDSFAKGLENQYFACGTWAPPIDIFETEGQFVLKAELPGINKDDVDVRIQDNVLTLKGARYPSDKLKEDNINRMERPYGKFSRSFTLPSNINADNISAKLKDGILEITLPKI